MATETPPPIIRGKNALYPITHKFVIRSPGPIPPDGFIFEYYNTRPSLSWDAQGNVGLVFPPNIEGTEQATNLTGRIPWRASSWQGVTIAVYIDTISTPTPRWGWRAYPNSDFQSRPYYLNAAASRVWFPQGNLFQETKPSYGTLYDGLGALFGGLREMAWHEGSPPSTNFPFRRHIRVSRRGSDAFWGVMYIYDWEPPLSFDFPTHVWMEIFYSPSPHPWPYTRDLVYWIRGAGNLAWPASLRNTPINEALFPPGGSGIRRLSLDWYHRPWERYPHLI